MLGLRFGYSRGDTIIEVLLAITVFSTVAVGAITLMNQGTQSAQKALEITLVRQQIDAQAEALRFIQANAIDADNAAYNTAWKKLTTLAPAGKAVAPSAVRPLQVADDGSCPAPLNNAFILDAHNASISQDNVNGEVPGTEAPYAHVYYDKNSGKIAGGTGIWIEAAKPSNASRYVDFYIKTCWYAPGAGPATILGTIVRLYAP